jgi:hypothetical protein
MLGAHFYSVAITKGPIGKGALSKYELTFADNLVSSD